MQVFLCIYERLRGCWFLELNMVDKFVKWYRLTHWGYRSEWLEFEDGRLIHPETQAMYVAYRAGYNRHKKEK